MYVSNFQKIWFFFDKLFKESEEGSGGKSDNVVVIPFNLPDPRNFDTNAVLYIVVQLRTITEREEDFQVNEERSKD